MGAEQTWERLGSSDPFYGVLSFDRFRGQQLDEQQLQQFLSTGEVHMSRVFELLEQHFEFTPHGRALDFGCGVGRLVFPMTDRFDHVVGLDISEGMLSTAQSLASKQNRSNVEFVNSKNGFPTFNEKFDFVHSHIVLQHMPRSLGEAAIQYMIEGLAPNGVGAIHFTYGHSNGPLRHGLREFVKTVPPLRIMGNLALGRKWNAPSMLMTRYSINRILNLMGSFGIEKFFVHRIDDWGHYGLYVFFQKSANGTSEFSNPVSD